MDEVQMFARDLVYDEELLARIVLSPRDIDEETGLPKDDFIRLREDETGISFLRFDYLGKELFLACGEARSNKYSKRNKKELFIGWMQSPVSNIVDLDPTTIFVSIEKPNEHPEHVVVCFKKESEIVKGIVTDAYILALIDELYHVLEYVRIE